MSSQATISIIVCTRNRAPSLQSTLAALGGQNVPCDWNLEVLVVDNGSTDDTGRIAQGTTLPGATLRYISEPRQGKSHALNTALAKATGEILLFTDDDVLPTKDWVAKMARPLLDETFSAVTGQLALGRDLAREWMTQMHKMWLALSLDAASRDWSRELIGANMGIRRCVLLQVPAFDPELGPGPKAVGFCEDTLFGMQVAEAGFKVGYVAEAIAVHMLDSSRLQRQAWLADARKRGATQGYLRHHWEHGQIRLVRLKWLSFALRLWLRRRLTKLPAMDSEGCPAWEMSYVMNMEMCARFSHERMRPRNYAPRGLRKLGGEC